MYRQRIHFTARDRQGWNDIVEATDEINAICSSKGLATGTLWTQTVGQFNELIAEFDYASLAEFEAWTKALYADPEVGKQMSRITGGAIPDKGYTELFEQAGAV